MNDYTDIDVVNRETMRLVVDSYSNETTLTESEAAAIMSIADEMRGKRILDIGVGGGRTTLPLMTISSDYVGVDYVEAMVERSRQRFPNVCYEHADARSMPQFADRSFDLIVFSLNGISMVDHTGRLAILHEAKRLLSSGGIFVFSTYNRDSPALHRPFEPPYFQLTLNPLRLILRIARFLKYYVARKLNRIRHRRYEISTNEYAIINDRCHDYKTMLYYISPEHQRRQLEQVGFQSDPAIYDLAGHPVKNSSLDDSLTYVARAF